MSNTRVFPRVMYHPAEGSRVVGSAAEELALGEAWSDTPVVAEDDHERTLNERIDELEARFAEIETAVAELRNNRRKAK